MKGRPILLALLFLLLLTDAFGQTVTVVDRESREPLIGVNVFADDRSAATATDSRGRADLEEFAGMETIIFSYVGYEQRRLSYREIVDGDGVGVVALDRKPISLGQAVVSANRWVQDSREIPVTISRISPEEVRLQNPQTAADLLGVSNEVYIQKSQMGGGSPMIRGFATNRVLLVVDGVRMNNAIFRSGNLQNVISLDPNAISNTEVVFGPGSVIYGSDAIGGVMSFNTLSPRLSTGDRPRIDGAALTRVASANWGKTAHLDLNLGYRNWGAVTSLTYSDFEHMRMGSHGPDGYLREQFVRSADGRDLVLENTDPLIQKPTAYRQLNLMQKFRYRPSDKLDLEVGVHYSTTGDIPRYDRLTERRNGQFREAEWYYGPQQWFMGNVNALYYSESKLFDHLKAVLAYQDYGESRSDRSLDSNRLRTRSEQVRAYSLNLDFEKKLDERTTLFYGTEGVVNRVYSDAEIRNIALGTAGPAPTRYPDGSSWQSYAAFLNLKHNLDPRWTLTAGLRYNRYLIDAEIDAPQFPYDFGRADINRGAFTGSLGTVFRPTDTWQFNLHLSSGFRSPNIDDIGKIFDSEPGSVIVPNPGLDPEYAYNGEIGVQKVIADRVKLDLAGFYTLLDNALARRDYRLLVDGQPRDSVIYDGTLSRVQAIQNVASARVYGIQARLEYQFSPVFDLRTHINFQRGYEREPDGRKVPLRHVAPNFGSTHLVITPGSWTIDLYADYNGEVTFEDLAPSERSKPHLYARDANGRPYSPSWYTLNLKSSYRLSEAVSMHLGIENITDRRYRTYSSGIAAPGRNVIFALRGYL